MEKREEVEIKAKVNGISNRLVNLKIKHDNLSHRVDGIDEELNEIWEVIGRQRKDTKQNEK